MKRLNIFVLAIFSACAVLNKGKTNNNQVLFTVAADTVTVEEFLYAFQKNRPEDSLVLKAEVDEYLDLYKKFKLKVAEAMALGMDTTNAFRQEFNTYLNQLNNNYLQTANDTDSLVKQAFDRMQYQVKASHILLLAEASTPPEDTLAIYNKLLAIRDSIMNYGAEFGHMAQLYSEDPSAQQNQGDLGYFSVFQMVYPFENSAFNTAVGEISQPFRTRFGYHLLQVNDKRPNEGRVRVAHIMLRPSAEAEDKAFDLYSQLKAGADWNQLCADNSEDYQSANRGGELTPFSQGQIVKPFADVAFGLDTPGEFSEPIQTPYGWHIIKLIEKLGVHDFDKMQQQLAVQVRRDERSKVSEQRLLDRLATKNNLIENSQNIQLVINPDKYHYENNKFQFNSDSLAALVLFEINHIPYAADSLYTYINNSGNQQKTRQFLFDKYNNYKAAALTNYEKDHLAENYPEYKFLRKEYHDGILLFSIMEELIWNPASTDSTGIQTYYIENKELYIDSTTVEMAVFSSSDKEKIDSIKAEYPNKQNFVKLSKAEKDALSTPKNDSTKVSLQLEYGEFALVNQPLVAKIGVPDAPVVSHYNGLWYYVIPLRQPGEPRRLTNIRGRLIADYQDSLEADWLQTLAKKYLVKIDEKGLKYVYEVLDTQ